MSSLPRAVRIHALRLLLAVALLTACGDGTPPAVPGAQLPLAWLSVGPHRISAELALNPADRSRGLMFRASLPADHGMLFVFPNESVQAFWMRNTTIPLSIAYADGDGRIVRIADLEPLDERPVPSFAPIRYALEMNRGWFSAHAVVVGDRITDIPERAQR